MKQKQIEEQISVLKGMQLAGSWLAADMRTFSFCIPGETSSSSTSISLHVQCPWRIEKDDHIITGRYDYWEPLKDLNEEEYKAWDPNKDGNLQEHIMADLLKQSFYVKEVSYTGCGGIALNFTNGTKLCLFPHGTHSEDWRLFIKGQIPHFVISGGEIEDQNE